MPGVTEVALNTDFAREFGVPQFGKVQGTFSGGELMTVELRLPHRDQLAKCRVGPGLTFVLTLNAISQLP